MKSPDIFTQNVRVAADIKIIPNASVGDIETCCVGDPVLEPCSDSDSCAYMVSQMVCVRFPLCISSAVEVSAGIVCGEPDCNCCQCEFPSCESGDCGSSSYESSHCGFPCCKSRDCGSPSCDSCDEFGHEKCSDCQPSTDSGSTVLPLILLKRIISEQRERLESESHISELLKSIRHQEQRGECTGNVLPTSSKGRSGKQKSRKRRRHHRIDA